MSQNRWNKAEGKEMLVRMNGLWRKKCGTGGGGQVVGSNLMEIYDLRNEEKGRF